MPRHKASTTHHCPKKKKGNCRHNKKAGYCTAHQTLCDEHGVVHLQDESCYQCRKPFFVPLSPVLSLFDGLWDCVGDKVAQYAEE